MGGEKVTRAQLILESYECPHEHPENCLILPRGGTGRSDIRGSGRVPAAESSCSATLILGFSVPVFRSHGCRDHVVAFELFSFATAA